MKQREESFRLLFKNNPMPMGHRAGDAEVLGRNAAVAHYGYSRDEFCR
jgi:hypothetical protein